MKKLILFVTIVALTPMLSYAQDIGFGKVVAIKEHAYSSGGYTKIYLSSTSQWKNVDCLENERPVAVIDHAHFETETVNRMVSLAMSAYISGKKLRLFSNKENCNADFVALQEERF